jgi:antitoxin component of RelBE/YafQ-DinJ toxin-antitoxin module
MRKHVFTVRISAEESARLAAVSTHYGLNASNTIRLIIKREADALLPTPRPTRSHP